MVGSRFGEKDPRTWTKDYQRPEVNCRPRSVVITSGLQKREIQPLIISEAHDSAIMSVSWTASGQWVQRSTIVKRYRQPWEIAKGLTMSTCTCPKWPEGASKTWTRWWVCFCTLEVWHARQALARREMSFFVLCHTKWRRTRRMDALTPGWESLCIRSKTVWTHVAGTNGRGSPDKILQTIVTCNHDMVDLQAGDGCCK